MSPVGYTGVYTVWCSRSQTFTCTGHYEKQGLKNPRKFMKLSSVWVTYLASPYNIQVNWYLALKCDAQSWWLSIVILGRKMNKNKLIPLPFFFHALTVSLTNIWLLLRGLSLPSRGVGGLPQQAQPPSVKGRWLTLWREVWRGGSLQGCCSRDLASRSHPQVSIFVCTLVHLHCCTSTVTFPRSPPGLCHLHFSVVTAFSALLKNHTPDRFPPLLPKLFRGIPLFFE